MQYLNDIVYIGSGTAMFNNAIKGDCYTSTYGHSCRDNIIGNNCYNITTGNTFTTNRIDDYSNNDLFGDSCSYNNIGSYFKNNTVCKSSVSNTFGIGCLYFRFFYGDASTSSSSNRYYTVQGGTKGAEGSPLSFTGTSGNNYVTYVGMNSSGTLKSWVPADQAP